MMAAARPSAPLPTWLLAFVPGASISDSPSSSASRFASISVIPAIVLTGSE